MSKKHLVLPSLAVALEASGLCEMPRPAKELPRSVRQGGFVGGPWARGAWWAKKGAKKAGIGDVVGPTWPPALAMGQRPLGTSAGRGQHAPEGEMLPVPFVPGPEPGCALCREGATRARTRTCCSYPFPGPREASCPHGHAR